MVQRIQKPAFLAWPICQEILSNAAALGSEARFVGGAVRNHLLGKPVDDVDMAVTAPITLIADRLKQAGLAVYETGIDHGTITVRYKQHIVELTQTRIDMNTDGRHAVVQPVDDWLEDAKRRDFTINAFYMNGDGILFDPLDAMVDLETGILRFIGDPDRRIQEDYLRIMRGFRFVSEYPELRLSEAGIAAIKRHLDGLDRLSGERVTTEWMRLVSAHGWRHALHLAETAGLTQKLLGTKTKIKFTASYGESLTALGRFAWQLGPGARVPAWVRLSRADTDLLHLYLDKLDSGVVDALLADEHWQQAAYQLGAEAYQRLLLFLLWETKEADADRLNQLATYQPPTFPLRGADLITIGIAPGVGLGQMLLSLEDRWVKSDFQFSKDELMAHARSLSDKQPG